MNGLQMEDLIEIQLPPGKNAREVQQNFMKDVFPQKLVYDSIKDRGYRPTGEILQELLKKAPAGTVIAVFAGDPSVDGNTHHSFILKTGQVWEILVGVMKMYPKLVIMVPWESVCHLVIQPMNSPS